MKYPVKFLIGDRPFVVSYDVKHLDEEKDCYICDNKRSVVLEGETFVCPECNGGENVLEITNIQVVQVDPITSMYFSIMNENRLYNVREYHANVICYKGVEQSYDECELYATKEEADAAVAYLKENNELEEEKQPFEFTKFIDLKFEFKQPVYILKIIEYVRVNVKCRICRGSGEVTIKHKKFDCPACNGGYTSEYIGEMVEVVATSIDGIVVEIDSDGVTDMYYVEGAAISECNLFDTEEAADIECRKRNHQVALKMAKMMEKNDEIS